MDYQAVETNLNTVMARVAPLVSEIDANDIREFVQAGEYGLAFELLCHALATGQQPISAEVYALIDTLGSQLELDSCRWELLKPFIKA